MRSNTLVVAVIVIVIGYSLSCVSRGHDQKPANSRSEESITILRPVPAVLNEETHPTVEAIEIQVKGKAGEPFDFKHAQFIDENHGWAMTEYWLYRTNDGGMTWERLQQNPEKDGRFTAFFFVDESRGWLAAVKEVPAKRYGLGNSSVIMVTNNGGKSWQLQARFPDEVVIHEIRFLNPTDGLAVGARMVDGGVQVYEELLVLRTSNGGNEWKNTSEPAKAVIKNEYGMANDAGRHIEWLSASSVLLLTRFGKVISTTDSGKTWSLVATFKNDRPNGFTSPTAMHKLALDPQGRIRVVAGAIGDDVYHGEDLKSNWGQFVVQEDGGWRTYELDQTAIVDAVLLSDKEVLACGLNMRPGDEKANSRLKNAGVILRSFDGGKSWQTIYRSKSYETFFFLTKVKENQFYALSDTGTFVRFTL
ncbi:MAG TPA: hypothetical protein VFB65_03985 [Pyrinomonadaceae bacterium]|nr:hypothetical protein [Pyrinomonadaceae bacterium]